MLFDTFKELDRISSAFFSGLPESALSSAPVNLYRLFAIKGVGAV